MNITPEFQGLLENDAIMIGTLCKAVNDRYGKEGIAVLREAMRKKYGRIIPSATKLAGAKTGHGGIVDWVRVEPYFGERMGMEGEFEITRLNKSKIVA